MLRNLLIGFGIVILINSKAHTQPIPVEVFGGTNYGYYQHALERELSKGSKFSFFNAASVNINYKTDLLNEIMIQGYLTHKLIKNLDLGLGFFFNNVPGFSPTGIVRYTKISNNWFFTAIARVDIINNPSYEVFSILQFKPKISDNISLYTRAQIMTNVGNRYHNRSYQYFRIGFDIKQFQFGAGLHLDEFGPEKHLTYNPGLFIRKDFF